MSKHSELDSYIEALRKRLRLGAGFRGGAIIAATALGVTILLVLVLNRFAFPLLGITFARVALAGALAAAAALGAAVPLIRLTEARAVHRAEAANPELEQRLTTFYEREQARVATEGDPFAELLAADTLALAQHIEPSSLVPDDRLFALAGAGLACFGVLVWMILAGPGYLGYGASLLWMGPAKNLAPLYALAVTPGNTVVRRNSDELIAAHVSGMRPDKVQLFAHFQNAAGWEPVPCSRRPMSAGKGSINFRSPVCRRTSSIMWPPARSSRRTTRFGWLTCLR